ncbi:MAG: energy transducer TonB [Terriglobales bacterium]
MDFPEFQIPEHPPLWRQLARELREWIHPTSLPELSLDSQPIPVKQIWTHPPRLRHRLISVAINLAVIAVILFPFWRPVHLPVAQPEQTILIPTIYAPDPTLPKFRHLAGGGVPLHLPVPPKLLPAPLHPQPAQASFQLIPATAPANAPLPQFGQFGPIAAPPGNSFGAVGKGPGGPGDDASGGGACRNAPCRVGGNISTPIPIFDPQPQYSPAAREAKFQGTIIIAVIIGADGRVYDAQILRSVGLGLDQKALEAVALWRFQPAERNGHPVRVRADIQVNFHLY